MATATLTAAAPYIIRQDYAAYTDEAAQHLGGARGPCVSRA